MIVSTKTTHEITLGKEDIELLRRLGALNGYVDPDKKNYPLWAADRITLVFHSSSRTGE